MSPRVVAVDIGNSALKFALRRPDDDAADYHTARLPLGDLDTGASVQAAVESLLGGPLSRHAPIEWRMASVHRGALAQWLDWIHRRRSADQFRTVSGRDVPLACDLPHPDRVGTDRLLAAWQAQRSFGGAGPVVVVDAGSAVTVDWVDAAGTFRGGAILPGLRLQLASLASGTDALPLLSAADLAAPPDGGPGRDTAAAIAQGVAAAVAGGVDRLVEQYRGLAAPATVVLTGGDADWLAARLRHPHRLRPNLVLDALLGIR